MTENSNKDKYEFGQCKGCNKSTSLKNGYCKDCENPLNVFKDMFDKDIFDLNGFGGAN